MAGVVLLAGSMLAISAAPTKAATPGYLTIQFGRSMEGSYILGQGSTACAPVPGILTLSQIAQDLQTRGMTATAAVVVSFTKSTAESCIDGDIYADWADLQSLNALYGWHVVSAGVTYSNITTMTSAQQQAESCGSLPSFTAEGLNADGLFAYPNNWWNTTVQTKVVSTCFDYGRNYKNVANNESTMNPDGIQNTIGIVGGACDTVGAPCYRPISGQKNKRYENPATFEALVAREGTAQWIDLQIYKLVSGSSSDGMYSWDCTSSDPTLHWTSQPELYCQNDFDAILNSVPAGIVVTDPASVAAAWGRVIP
jgi:hypothetical protein